MKVREWLENQGKIGKALVTPDSDLSCFVPSLLDAEVIGLPCKTCGGKGKCKDIWAGAVREVACPDCADTPVYVIAPEAWEAFVCSRSSVTLDTDTKEGAWEIARDSFQHNRRSFNEWWEAQEASARRALQALLPGARVAEEIVAVDSSRAHKQAGLEGRRSWHEPPEPHCPSDDIAILAKQEEAGNDPRADGRDSGGAGLRPGRDT